MAHPTVVVRQSDGVFCPPENFTYLHTIRLFSAHPTVVVRQSGGVFCPLENLTYLRTI
jgi:hypothetical protein